MKFKGVENKLISEIGELKKIRKFNEIKKEREIKNLGVKNKRRHSS